MYGKTYHDSIYNKYNLDFINDARYKGKVTGDLGKIVPDICKEQQDEAKKYGFSGAIYCANVNKLNNQLESHPVHITYNYYVTYVRSQGPLCPNNMPHGDVRKYRAYIDCLDRFSNAECAAKYGCTKIEPTSCLIQMGYKTLAPVEDD